MAQTVVIDPVTRIEGHAKISIQLDDAGKVTDAHFHVTQFRGFEAFCEGRPFWEMPGLTARICGICPVSHLLCSAKAGDEILSVRIPPTATKLRRLMNLGQILQSHALSFFHLSAPDLILGMDADPKVRNVFGLMTADPELTRKGIRLRQFGQEIIEHLGNRKIHPSWSVPGGVREPLSEEKRLAMLERLPEARDTIQIALDLFKRLIDQFPAEIEFLGNFPSLYMGLISPDGLWEHYDGGLRFVDSNGTILADHLDPKQYMNVVGEAVDPLSYLKSPYYRPMGPSDQNQDVEIAQGMYRVGPLARLNICSRMGTPQADQELQEYRDRCGTNGMVHASFYYHYARLVEIVAALERIEGFLTDPEITSTRVRSQADVNQLEGIGASEAPRGTLFHHYHVDETGLIQKVNMIIATGQNNLAMNQAVTQVAQHFIQGPEIPEGMLNRVEASIRAFDPCLSCSTHAIGQMPLHIQMLGSDGSLVNEVWRH